MLVAPTTGYTLPLLLLLHHGLHIQRSQKPIGKFVRIRFYQYKYRPSDLHACLCHLISNITVEVDTAELGSGLLREGHEQGCVLLRLRFRAQSWTLCCSLLCKRQCNIMYSTNCGGLQRTPVLLFFFIISIRSLGV